MDLAKIKGVIFDLDGVLIDTEKFQWQIWAKVLKSFKISLPKKEYFNYAGKRGDIIASELIIKYSLKTTKSELKKKKEKLSIEWIKTKNIKLMPYAKNAIKFFSKKKIAVASGGSRKEVILKLKRAKLYSLFKNIVSGNEVKRGKPFPDIYLKTLKKLRLKNDECIAFEDTQYGLESAKYAGLTCFAIPNEFSIKQDFSKADKIFSSLKAVIDFLKNEPAPAVQHS